MQFILTPNPWDARFRWNEREIIRLHFAGEFLKSKAEISELKLFNLALFSQWEISILGSSGLWSWDKLSSYLSPPLSIWHLTLLWCHTPRFSLVSSALIGQSQRLTICVCDRNHPPWSAGGGEWSMSHQPGPGHVMIPVWVDCIIQLSPASLMFPLLRIIEHH